VVIFTLSADKPFASYLPEEIPFKDQKLSISSETQEMMEESVILLRFNCPESNCDFIGTGWNDLKMHVRAVHGRQLWSVALFTFSISFFGTKTLYCLAISAFEIRKSFRMSMSFTPTPC
jgi:hypothetical protein